MTPINASDDALEQAITWMVRLRSGEAPEEQWQACARWRAECPRHESAWQALQASEGVFELPSGQARIARQALETSSRVALSRRQSLKLLGWVGASWWVLDTIESRPSDFTTAIGQRSSFALNAHTHLWLNTDSAVDRPTASQPARIVLQRGQIQITHNAPALEPLQVRSGELVLQTREARFDLYRQGQQHYLAILEGSADVQFAHHPMARLTAGHLWRIGVDGRRPVLDSPMTPGTWVQGQLVVKRIPLGQLVQELARYRSGWLQCANEVANLPVSGVFQLDDIEHTLDVLNATLPVKTRRLSTLWARVVPA